MLINIHKKIWF